MYIVELNALITILMLTHYIQKTIGSVVSVCLKFYLKRVEVTGSTVALASSSVEQAFDKFDACTSQ